MTGNSTGLPQIGAALLRHRLKVGMAFVMVMFVTAAALVLLPREYQSEALLVVRLGRENVTLDPTVTTGQTVSLSDPREGEINTILEVMRSRALAEQVIDGVGVGEYFGDAVRATVGSSGLSVGRLFDILEQTLHPESRISPREKAVRHLQASLHISSPKSSNLIRITCDSKSPALAQRVVSTFLDAYMKAHARLNRESGTYGFFVDQLSLLDDQWQTAATTLRDIKNRMGVASADSKRDLLQSELKEIETEQIRTETALAASRAKRDDLRESVAKLPSRLVTAVTSGHPNLAGDRMREKLYELEILEGELAAKFTADHPPLIQVREQLSQARRILGLQDKQRIQQTEGMNPSRQTLQLNVYMEDANVSALARKAESLQGKRQRVLQELAQLNHDEVLLAEAQRDADIAASNYRVYADKLEQARIHAAMEKDRITNVKIAQPASFVGRPIRPNRILLVTGGFLLALATSVGVAVLADSREGRLTKREYVVRDGTTRLGVRLNNLRHAARAGHRRGP